MSTLSGRRKSGTASAPGGMVEVSDLLRVVVVVVRGGHGGVGGVGVGARRAAAGREERGWPGGEEVLGGGVGPGAR